MVVYAGLFETENKAKEAFGKLIELGLKANEVFMISPAEGATKVKEILGSARNAEFRRMTNRMKAALEAGRALVGARPAMFYAAPVERVFDEVGAAQVLENSDSTPRFFSQFVGIPTLTLSGRPRVTVIRKPLTQTLGKTMLYKRPVTATLGKKMLLPSKPITETWLGKQMLMPSKPITETWLGKRMLLPSKPITQTWLGKKMLMQSRPITERLGKTMIYSEISKRD